MTRLFLILGLCLLSSCQILQKLTAGKPKKEEPKTGPSEVNIGIIDLVNPDPDQHFVLIRTLAHMMLAPGTMLYSTNAQGQQTKLKVSPEHKGSFLAADIVSGSPQKNDTVMFHATSSAPPALTGGKPLTGGPGAIPTAPTSDAPLAPFPMPVQFTPNPSANPSPPPSEPAPTEFLRPVPSVPTNQPQ